MKLEKRFDVTDGQLKNISTNEAVADIAGMAFPVRWSAVEPSADSYDEAFLAELRTTLKEAESKNTFVFIEPVYDRNDGTVEQFIAAMKHCARRIKDCVSVVGFALPAQLVSSGFTLSSYAASFMEALLQKHAHYVFFAKRADFCGTDSSDSIVLY